MNARDYYLSLQAAIHAAPHVLRSDMRFEEIDINECYVRGVLSFIAGFELHISEYVVSEPTVTRLKYRYHLQASDGGLVSRWDNAPHHPEISGFPDHRHGKYGEIHSASPMNVPAVLDAVLQLITPIPANSKTT
ncbi:MAG: DUF6516 family protein [Thermodesulfobacteriota bacterium]